MYSVTPAGIRHDDEFPIAAATAPTVTEPCYTTRTMTLVFATASY